MSSLATRVLPEQRFTRRTLDCPVCGGTADDPHGQGIRCTGYVGDDPRYVYCSRPEHAGPLLAIVTAAEPVYRHVVAGGDCRCGIAHGELNAAVVQRVASAAEQPRKLHIRRERHLADGSRFVHEWRYEDASGALVYFVARYDPPTPDGRKKYLPWQPVGKHWACDERELTRVLYRLPELRVTALDVPVFIAEGEKCVEALRERGLVATCSAGGAGNWHKTPGARDELKGRTAIVLSDNDDPGRAHAEQVAADIVGTAASVRIVALPGLAEHGDVYDWFAAGGDALQLALRALATPVYGAAASVAAHDADGGDDDKEAQLAVSRERSARQLAEEANARLKARDAWDAKLRANTNLRPICKPTLQLVRDEWQRVARRAEQTMPVYRETWAERLGVPDKTVGTHLKKLEACGAIVRTLEHTNVLKNATQRP